MDISKMTGLNVNLPEGGLPRLAPVGQDKLIALQTNLLEAQQDTNGLLRDLIGEVRALRRVMEDSNG